MLSATIPLAMMYALAATCAPADPQERAYLVSVAQTESQLDALAIHDNSADGRSYHPASIDQAVQVATALIRARRSVDLGLMQVNSGNLASLRMTIADAFDPRLSMDGACRIWSIGKLRAAASFYNTGSLTRGFANGYVERVEVARRALTAPESAPPLPSNTPPSDGPANLLAADAGGQSNLLLAENE